MEFYEIIRSRRRTLALEVARDGRVLVRAPESLSQDRIDAFVQSHRKWILEKQAQQRQRPQLLPECPSPQEIAALKEKARTILPERVAYWSQQMGLQPTGVTITAARKRYGSCSASNRICLSCFLVNCPMEAIDLVVVHELCHIRVKNHGPDFYALLSQVLPDHRERKKLLW